MAGIKHVTEIEVLATGGTTGQTLVHDGARFTPSSALSQLLANRANIVKPNGNRVYYDTYPLAQTAAVPFDILIAPSNISDLTLPGNGAQIALEANVSLQTLGFQLGVDNAAADVITLYNRVAAPATSVGFIQGSNSVIYQNRTSGAGGPWGFGTYSSNSHDMDYSIYELNWRTTGTLSASSILIASPTSKFSFYNCSIYHNNAGYCIRIAHSVVNFYNCNIDVSGGGDIVSYYNASVINFYNCTIKVGGTSSIYYAAVSTGCFLNFYECIIDGRTRTKTTQFIGGDTKISSVALINSTVIPNTGATFAIQADTIVLEGTTTVTGTLSYNTLTDNRPAAIKGIVPIVSTEVTLATDPNGMTTSAPRLISGIVADVTDDYDSINTNSGVSSSHFTFNYKLPTDANWTNGVSFATLKPILINTSDANKRIYVSATNLTSLVPAAAILNIKR